MIARELIPACDRQPHFGGREMAASAANTNDDTSRWPDFDDVPSTFGNDLGAIELPVFHGTRRSSALAIYEHGFRIRPVAKQRVAAAAAHDIPLETLHSHLMATGRFEHLYERPGTVSLTADPGRAGGWANRASEATWEALLSVHRLLNPDSGDDWNESPEGRFWVLAQQIADPPVIIQVGAPITALWKWPSEVTAADLLEELIRESRSEEFVKLFFAAPEWRAEPGHLTLAGVQEVQTRLDYRLATFVSGKDPATFNEQVHEGHWGKPDGCDSTGMPWWSFGEMWRRLTPVRRAELEAFAGRALG